MAIGSVAEVPRARRVDGELIAAQRQHRHVLRLVGVDVRIHQPLLVGLLGRNFLLINPHVHEAAGQRIAGAAVHHETESGVPARPW